MICYQMLPKLRYLFLVLAWSMHFMVNAQSGQPDIAGKWSAKGCPGASGFWGFGGWKKLNFDLTLERQGPQVSGTISYNNKPTNLNGSSAGNTASFRTGWNSNHSVTMSPDGTSLTDKWCNKDGGCSTCTYARVGPVNVIAASSQTDGQTSSNVVDEPFTELDPLLWDQQTLLEQDRVYRKQCSGAGRFSDTCQYIANAIDSAQARLLSERQRRGAVLGELGDTVETESQSQPRMEDDADEAQSVRNQASHFSSSGSEDAGGPSEVELIGFPQKCYAHGCWGTWPELCESATARHDGCVARGGVTCDVYKKQADNFCSCLSLCSKAVCTKMAVEEDKCYQGHYRGL